MAYVFDEIRYELNGVSLNQLESGALALVQDGHQLLSILILLLLVDIYIFKLLGRFAEDFNELILLRSKDD